MQKDEARVALFISTCYIVFQFSSSNNLAILKYRKTKLFLVSFKTKQKNLKNKNSERNKFDPNDKSVNWITHNHFLPWAFAFV